MLRFITKKEYWAAEDDGTVELLPAAPFAWHLKNIQDAVAMSRLRDCAGKDIAEIGGGDSRVLHAVSRANRVTNIDSFEGLGNGPVGKPENPAYRIVPCLIGSFDDRLAPESFDIVFSISVVEHVPGEALADFHRDCLRILRPGGLLFHLIDIYLRDDPERNSGAGERIARYAEWFAHDQCEPFDPGQVRDPARYAQAGARSAARPNRGTREGIPPD